MEKKKKKARKKTEAETTTHTDQRPAEEGQQLSHVPARRTADRPLGVSALAETPPPLVANVSPPKANKETIFLISFFGGRGQGTVKIKRDQCHEVQL